MRISTRRTLLFALSAVSATAVYALTTLARSRGDLAGELRKVAQNVRKLVDGLGEDGAPPSSEDTLLSRAMVEGTTLDELEKTYILLVLEQVEGNRTRAAEILGIGRRTLYRKLSDYGIDEDGTEGT
jgi:DNA-binding NtrC family response regulator